MTDPVREKVSVAWRLPCLSQEFESGPVAELHRGRLALRYDFETDTGDYEWEALIFRGVISALFTDHESCTADQVAAYDKLVEVEGSEWVQKLRSARIEPARGVRHLRIYFDELGCYDVAASDFEPPPERPSSDVTAF